MYEHLSMGSSLSDHWPDILLGAFLAAAGWLLRRDISAMDKRHERAENKFEEQGGQLADHETRITVLEQPPRRDKRDT